MRKLIMIASLILSGCQAMEAASCEDGDIACIAASFDQKDLNTAIRYFGPCYDFGEELCERAYECFGHDLVPGRRTCEKWWTENVCAYNPFFDPLQHEQCADWSEQIPCDYFEFPEDYGEQVCEALYPHPLGGGWTDLSEGATRPSMSH